MMASITTWISSAGYARLVEIFSGKEVAVLFDGTADANHTYHVTFDAAKLEIGMFTCRLTTHDEIKVAKLILAK
jgi:hypothetical protein